MDLREQPFFFFDAQTTGIRPPTGRLIDFGWSLASALNCDLAPVSSQRFSLPGEHRLSRKVTEITGYTEQDLEGQPTPESWCAGVFKPWLQQAGPEVDAALIHYAQFETPFLEQLLEKLPFPILCTHQIIRRLYPMLPSQNIRAVAGFFGHPMLGPNRSGEFVKATQVIWRGACDELTKRGVTSVEDLRDFLAQPIEKKPRGYSYRISTAQRLGLPDQPGIYRMLAKNGEVLYVGKATSLRDRVNSYFRGVKGREKRKLEMLAQTWDLQVEVCGSPLEAALRETDEIKRLNPRYNVSLKAGHRQLCFYSVDFGSSDIRQSELHPIGPFRPGNFIDMVQALYRSLGAEEFEQIFYEPLDPSVMKAGFAIFLQNHGLRIEQITSIRSLLAYGAKLFRHYVEPEELESKDKDEDADEEAEKELTAEDLAGKFERLLRRAGGELRRAKRLTQVLNSDVEFKHGEEWRRLELRDAAGRWPWGTIGIEAYDRASILLSELSRLEHKLHKLADLPVGKSSAPKR